VNVIVPDRRAGLLLMLAAGLCWSLGGIIVRSLALKDTWEIVFWRALFMAGFLGLLLVLRHRGDAWRHVRGIGAAGLISGVCLAAQIHFFILALTHTSAANTFVLMSVSPLLAALVGMLFLGERVRWHTWLAIAFALGGIVLMFGEGLDGGHRLGNIFALCVPLGYACQILFVRRVQGGAGGPPDLMATVFVGALIAALPGLAMGWPLEAGGADLCLLALMGCVQLGLGCWLMTLAIPHLRAAEMGLMALVETILAPVWVWLGVGEAPGAAALTGGAVIIGALALNGWFGLREAPRA
jgi:drug/metabolite transporter (DMT)-like permease